MEEKLDPNLLNVEKFIDDKIEHKEDDIEKIQTKPNI